MDSGNYLNFPASSRTRYLYRIISIDRLFELFENKENVLVKPRKWEDPFENFILRSHVQLPTGEIATFGLRDQFYGQCWTLHSASDAMWRIYSPDKRAVRIRSTVQKLARSLSQALGDWAQIQAYIGKVSYLTEKRLITYAKSVFRTARTPSSKMFAQTLLVKRTAFKHEREVRLLFFQHTEHLAKNDLYTYQINPHELIEQIMIDPRMTVTEANELKKKIQRKTGYCGKIVRSLLYAAPPEMVLPFGEAPNSTFNPDAQKQRAG